MSDTKYCVVYYLHNPLFKDHIDIYEVIGPLTWSEATDLETQTGRKIFNYAIEKKLSTRIVKIHLPS